MRLPSERAPDVVVIGAGLIGLSIALELSGRGANVTVVERGQAMAGASTAAAGMLAVDDPGNPHELRELSTFSAERYPAFLSRLQALSGITVPFQTDTTIQYLADGSTTRLAEHSLDPRQLAAAILAAMRATTSVRLLEHTQITAIDQRHHGATIQLTNAAAIATDAVLYAAGAWTTEAMTGLHADPIPVTPCKGQMLRVRLPFPLEEVHRSERVYICPRTAGPQAGTALIGATVENAGFDTSVHAADLASLRAFAAELLPAFASESQFPTVEFWAGLRPSTPDNLPVLGACSRPGHFIATGHYRNGILQAPGTAIVMADILEGKTPAFDLSGLSPQRFTLSTIA